MGKWTYRIAMIVMLVAIAGAGIYWVLSQTNPETDPGPYRGDDTWLLYPNGGDSVSGIITILWNPDKTKELDSDDKIWIGWSHDVRGAGGTEGKWPYPQGVFKHEDWEGCYCSMYNAITDSAPNTGEYQWNATEVLEECNGETYPYYIKIMGGKYMDASDFYFNITG